MDQIMDQEAIADTITEHAGVVGIEYRFLPPDEFTEAFGHYPTARYGWTFPEIGFFCPEIISAQTAALSSKDALHYLHVILYLCDRHVYYAYVRRDLSVGDRHRLIEDELFDKADDSLRLVSAVELAALEGP